jgi:imidazolonepropionase-like amidohydrolase
LNANLLVGDTIVSSTTSTRANVLVVNGKITAVGQLGEPVPESDERIDYGGHD